MVVGWNSTVLCCSARAKRRFFGSKPGGANDVAKDPGDIWAATEPAAGPMSRRR
jgi:hypothetical protein